MVKRDVFGRVVSDQPSWGRRDRHSYSIYSPSTGFRPTLVGSEESPLPHRRLRCRFRPTLVGSEVLVAVTVALVALAFQTNPRGVGGSPCAYVPRLSRGFRPTLVGSEGGLLELALVVRRVSDQPSWGRRRASIHLSRITLVSDQPSWGRRALGRCLGWHRPSFQTNPRGVGGTRTVRTH